MADEFTEMARHQAHWTIIDTDDGVHLQLTGGNGEPVLYGQHYEDESSIRDAILLANSTPPERIKRVDRRGPHDRHS
jgi:hypothetical protein